MKRAANRQEVDTLYILGAGASRALTDVKLRKNDRSRNTTPVDKDFLSCLEHFQQKKGWQKESFEIVSKDWLSSTDLLKCGLEEAILKRVSDYDMLSALYPEKSRRKCSNQDYLNHLTHLVSDFLLKCRSNTSGYTKTFVNDVFPPGEGVDSYKNRIITFNYDLIIDRPILDRGISKKKMYFDRIVSKREYGIRRYSDEKFLHPLLLKLHGSLNWRCERPYFDQIVTGTVDQDERIPIWSNDTVCPSPSDDESILIIPPVPNKPITKASIFRMLWTTALEYLHEAHEIVIVGYSCPQTDALARSMFTLFNNKKVSDITIVDPSSDSLTKYHQLFKGRVRNEVRWHYYHSFSDYIKNKILCHEILL